MKPELTKEILSARRALEVLKFYSLVSDLTWDESVRKWVLGCELRIGSVPVNIPIATKWYVLIPETYPTGDIDICPAKVLGIDKTFHHQSLNLIGDTNVPWRKGKICVDTPFGSIGRREYDHEPMDSDERLRWHIKRAHEWLEAANNNQLVKDGDPFELPYIPYSETLCISFDESIGKLKDWDGNEELSGYAVISRHKNSRLAFLISLENVKGQTVVDDCEYGAGVFEGFTNTECAIWLRLKSIPVLPPWQIPRTFVELEQIFKKEGRDLKNELLALAQAIRDGKPHFLLLGFPVPKYSGGRPERFHWFAVKLPILTSNKTKGFRHNENACRARDMVILSDKSLMIKWVETENWSQDQLLSRIDGGSSLKNKKVLLVGAGAIGSCVAQICARNGAEELIIIDGQCLEAGNLCRHTLTIENVGYHKAEQVSRQVNLSFPHIKSSHINRSLVNCGDKEKAIIQECDVVLDCTGEDVVLSWLSNFEMDAKTLFASISVSFRARRLFYFSAYTSRFPLESFVKEIKPWILAERAILAKEELPLSGIGCWHPIFPAGADDIWLMTAMAAKLVLQDVGNPPAEPSLVVCEQELEKGICNGIRKIQKV